MKVNQNNRGIAPLIIVLVLALAVAVGGGTYYAKKQKTIKIKDTSSVANNQTKSQSETNANVNASAGVQLNSGTIRSLLSIGKDVVCTISGTNAQGSITGASYISGTMMRGDFSVQSQPMGTVESHMIRNGNDIFVWTGSQGAKMSFSMVTASGEAKAKSGVDLDSNIQYSCKDWVKDVSKFVVPTSVSFIDINAMLQGQANFKIPAH